MKNKYKYDFNLQPARARFNKDIKEIKLNIDYIDNLLTNLWEKIVVVGSAGNLGKYIYKELNKTDILIGIQRKKEQNNFECKDLSNSKMSSETFSLIKKHSSLDAIIICTGKSSKSSLKNSDQKFLESFKSNLLTVSNTIEAYQKVYKNKPTKIIVISSIAAIKVLKAPIEYSVTKSALNHYCQIKAKELAKFSINLNIISPGNILNKDNNWFIKKKIIL